MAWPRHAWLFKQVFLPSQHCRVSTRPRSKLVTSGTFFYEWYLQWCNVCFFSWNLQIRDLYELLSGQHRTNAGDQFVFGPRSDEVEWSAVFGYSLRPQIWKKMPRRLARRLSAGFQAKESQPQVRKQKQWEKLYSTPCVLPKDACQLQDEVWSEKMMKWLKAIRAQSKNKSFGERNFSQLTSDERNK